jgi:hypothetical protein
MGNYTKTVRGILLSLYIVLFGGIASLRAQNNNYFEKTFFISFDNGQQNQVAFIKFPKIHLYGTFEVTITGGYNYQLNIGKLTKRYMMLRNASSDYLTQSTEVVAASGELANQWKLGDFDNTTSQIPIYHLSNKGNCIVVRIEGALIHPESIASINSSLTVSEPVVSPNSETRDYMSIMQERVGIGTTNPQNLLDVNGTIRAKEVKVESGWADFVFKPDYQLKPLAEVEQFITTNGHLPEIPTEKEVAQNGVSLGEMNAKLLQKVEELTLYLIKQDGEIKSLNKKNEELEKEILNIKQQTR